MPNSSRLDPVLKDPVPTRAKREAAFVRSIDWTKVAARGKGPAPEVTIPGLDVPELARAWAPEKAQFPQLKRGSFQIPLGVSDARYEQIRNDAIRTFLGAMAKQGWAFYADAAHPFRVYPGVYPAWDVRDQTWILDRREFLVEAYFRFENPKPIRIELDPRWVEPLVIRPWPGSGPGPRRR